MNRLSHFFTSKQNNRVVAWQRGLAIDLDSFKAKCAAWKNTLESQPGLDWALYFEDGVEFAAALLGAWHARKRVFLPADILPNTLKKLAVDGFIGDMPGALLCGHENELADWRILSADEKLLVIYTSGSSGEPIAIEKSLAQLFNEAEAHYQLWGAMLEQVTVHATVSHQHIYGLLFKILLPLVAGIPFRAERLIYGEDIFAALSSESQILLISSPAHLKRLPQGLTWQNYTDRLKGVFSSGGALTQEAIEACYSLLGQAPIEIYGSSETGGVAWRCSRKEFDNRWQLLPGVTLTVQNGLPLIQSKFLPNAVWYTLSDNINVDQKSGSFELLGRADNIVKVEEKRISLTAIEQALTGCDLVKEARVVLLDGPRERLGGVVVPSESGWALYCEHGKRALNQRLQQLLATQVVACALPRNWRYVCALPVTSQGKTSKTMLLKMFDPCRPSIGVLSQTQQHAILLVEINALSPFFQGHFPTQPIFPGVAQLEWVVQLGRELFPLPSLFCRMDNIKFQQIILPDSKVTLNLEFDAQAGSLLFCFESSKGKHASGKLYFVDKL